MRDLAIALSACKWASAGEGGHSANGTGGCAVKRSCFACTAAPHAAVAEVQVAGVPGMRYRQAQLLACDHGGRCFHLVVHISARVFGPGLTRDLMRGLKASGPRPAMGLMAGSAKTLAFARAETRTGGKLELMANAPPSDRLISGHHSPG